MGTRFIDGPAAGVSLMLQRAPYLLRVTEDRNVSPDKRWDALDQPGDTAHSIETVYVYKLDIDTATRFHISRRPRTLSGWYCGGNYHFVADQPSQAILHDNGLFTVWTERFRADFDAAIRKGKSEEQK